jgi:hypothetical protein
MLAAKILIICNKLDSSDNIKPLLNKLKPLITQKNQAIEPKGVDAKRIKDILFI